MEIINRVPVNVSRLGLIQYHAGTKDVCNSQLMWAGVTVAWTLSQESL